MSTLDKLKKVALTGHSVTLAPQSIIEIADLLGEVKTSYANAHEQIKDLESKLAAAHDVRDSWKRRAWSAEEAMTALTNDVSAINNLLCNQEWAEHCTATEQGQTLEGFITALVGGITELREKMKQPATAHKKRLVNLIEKRAHNWTYGEGEGNASKGDVFAVEVVPLYEHPAIDAEPIYQLADDGKWYDVEKHIYDANVQAGYQGRIVYAGAPLAQNDYFGNLVAKARASAEKAMMKFPQPNYVLLKVAEEAGEVVQAGVHYAEGRMTWQDLEGETVQLLAMLIRLVTEGDQVNGIIPPKPINEGAK